jgi:hypothetical protein
VFLALALLLSFLRRFSWLVVALLFWTYILASHFYPGVVAINPFQLTTPRFEGQHWMLPADLLKAQLPLAAVMLLMAWFLFAGAGDRLARAYQKLTLSRAGVGMLAGAVAVTVILVIALIVYVGAGDPERRDVGAPKVARAVYADWTNAHAQSQFFSFVYPANLSDRAREAIAQADNIHEAVRKFLGSDSGGSIAVDMTGASPRHAGVAYWNTIRLDLAELEDPDTLRAVLGHETVHVYVNRISESRVEDAFNSTRFFNEGLATYLEHRLFGSAKTAQPERSMAAVMRHRREVDFEELIDNALLGRNRDVNAVYPLGEVFVAALVERYGDQAPGALLRAFARKDRPKQMQGMELWQDAFQSAGFSLETAIDAFYARLDGLVAENREFIARLPRIRGAVHFEEALIGVEPLGTPLAGWIVVCRLRQAEDTDEQRYITPFPDDDGTFWVTRSSLPAATFWFQLGIHEVGGNRTIWEPWSEIRRP